MIIDRTITIRASVHDVEISLLISIVLVIFVVFVFLRNVWATLIPSVAVPLSLIGTFGVMYICHYSLDNLSLMALTICTGFVVDDAIVVIENIARHIEAGMTPYDATMKGASEIGFTVISMSTSLVAVFIPILMMGGIVGRLFREFAVVLSVAIAVSLFISLTTTPMMCARFLKPEKGKKHNRLYRFSENALQSLACGLRFFTEVGVAPSVFDLAAHHRHRLPKRLPLRANSQRFFPATRHWTHQRLDPGRSRLVLRRHGHQDAPVHRDRDAGSGD